MKRPWLWIAAGLLLLATFAYLPAAGVSVGGLLGLLLILACPLMHFLGGHSHGGHHGAAPEARGRSGPAPAVPPAGRDEHETSGTTRSGEEA